LEQALAQAGDLDLREVAQWATSLGASKRDVARVLRRPESTVRAWVKTVVSAAD
jgi:transposase